MEQEMDHMIDEIKRLEADVERLTKALSALLLATCCEFRHHATIKVPTINKNGGGEVVRLSDQELPGLREFAMHQSLPWTAIKEPK